MKFKLYSLLLQLEHREEDMCIGRQIILTVILSWRTWTILSVGYCIHEVIGETF